MNYQKIYNQIIENAIQRDIDDYTEKHHIIPKSEGGTDDISNLVELTPREHYIAHKLLYKINPTKSRAAAWHVMTIDKTGKRYINSHEVAKARKAFIESISGKNNPMYGKGYLISGDKNPFYGKTHSEETKIKLSKTKLGTKRSEASKLKQAESLRGYKQSEEHKRKISESNKGKLLSKQSRIKISETLKNKEKIKCQYCNHHNSISMHSRWHGDNCKSNPKNSSVNWIIFWQGQFIIKYDIKEFCKEVGFNLKHMMRSIGYSNTLDDIEDLSKVIYRKVPKGKFKGLEVLRRPI